MPAEADDGITPQAVRVDLIVDVGTTVWGAGRAATGVPTAVTETPMDVVTGDDSSDDDVGELIWRSSRTGKALARGATKAATVAAACSGHKRVTNGDLATDYSDSRAG